MKNRRLILTASLFFAFMLLSASSHAISSKEAAWDAQNLEIRSAIERSDLAAALKAAEQAVATAREAFGDKHMKTAIALKKLSDIQRLNGRTLLAAATLGRAGEIWEGALGDGHPYVSGLASQGADDLAAAGDPGAGVRMMKRAVEDGKKYYGERHSAVATSLLRLARLERAAGMDRESLLYEREAAGILKDSLGPASPRTLDAYMQICGRLAASGELNAARVELKRALDGAKASAHPPLLKLAQTYSLSGDLALQDRDLVEAESSYDTAKELLNRAGDTASQEDRLNLLYKLREFYHAAGREADAARADEQARAIERSMKAGLVTVAE
jgi:hypothetical protein